MRATRINKLTQVIADGRCVLSWLKYTKVNFSLPVLALVASIYTSFGNFPKPPDHTTTMLDALFIVCAIYVIRLREFI